jgi:hypothetical protein
MLLDFIDCPGPNQKFDAFERLLGFVVSLPLDRALAMRGNPRLVLEP